MSQEEKKNILDKTTTRRDFLKMTGKGVAGVAVSYSILSLFGCNTPKQEEKKEVPVAKGWAIATGILIADRSRCSGCQRCEINCTINNDSKVQPYISRVKVGRNYFYGIDGPKLAFWKEDGQFGNLTMNQETCKQCAEPYCGNACPAKAIKADPKTGARVVDEKECVGCGACVKACPWHIPTVDPETKKSKKCNLCNGDPQCAKYCTTGALKLIPWEQAKSVLNANGYMFV